MLIEVLRAGDSKQQIIVPLVESIFCVWRYIALIEASPLPHCPVYMMFPILCDVLTYLNKDDLAVL